MLVTEKCNEASVSILPPIDVMIPVADKDMGNVELAVDLLRRHSRNPLDNVHIVGAAALRDSLPSSLRGDVHWVDDESIRPTQAEVRDTLRNLNYPHSNGSWYFQQLLKLNTFGALGTSARHVLAIDADFTFVADTEFVDAQGRSWLANGYPLEWRPGVKNHALPQEHTALSSAARLAPGWQPVDAYSGMQHHMVFDRQIMMQLTEVVEGHHGMEFWRAVLHSIDREKWTGLSEYVIYRHFAANTVPEQIRARNVSAVDIIEPMQTAPYSLQAAVDAPRREGVQAIGCHQFRNYSGALSSMDYVPLDLRESLAKTEALALDMHEGVLSIAPLDTSRPLDLRPSA